MLPDNPLRGEVSVEIGGKAYRLTFDVSAFIYAQQATGKKMTEMVSAFTDDPDDLITLRAIFWAGLQRAHEMPLSAVDDLISTAGPAKVRHAVSSGLSAALGGKEEDGEAADPPRPRRRRGTG